MTPLAARAVDDNVFFGNNASAYYRDRFEYSRDKILAECLRAWRINPVARNIVRTITAFVIGKGLEVSSGHKGTGKFLQAWAAHPLNRLDRQFKRWMDENTRSGNLFFLFSVDQNTGMSYVRAVPMELVGEIQTAENDVEQARFFIPKEMGASPWPAWNPEEEQASFMVHFAVNQPVGVAWGEPDLAPMLPWIGRLSTLLEDRARLNRYRNAFLYMVKGFYPSRAEKQQRQAEVNADPPQPGTVLVTDVNEEWSVLSPELDSSDANTDILAIKKFIAAGVNFPLHWLAEPESSTRTTAEAAGTPTFRNLEDTQREFTRMVADLARIAVTVRRRFDRRVNPEAEIIVRGPDITERDNSLLALAVNRIYPALADLYDRKLLDEGELLRLVYRMSAETYDVEEAPKGIRVPPNGNADRTGPTPTEPDPGEPTDPKDNT